MRRGKHRWLRWSLLGLSTLPFAFHGLACALSRLTPPDILPLPSADVIVQGQTRRLQRNEAWLGPGLNVVRLEGTPEEIGASHTRLLYGEMLELEHRFSRRFEQYVPNRWSRLLLTDLARLRFFDVDEGMSLQQRREIAAMAKALSPDPFSQQLPTFQRLVYLNALYDISLSFENSPLLGCTTFFVAGDKTQNQPTLLARNFDFEVDPVFDTQKTLFVVKETGKIPYVSLSWPGLIGSVTAINQAGLAMVVHGGRAGKLSRTGEPVLHVLRDVLAQATSVDDAYRELTRHAVMVSHIIVMADASGSAAVVERVPQVSDYRYPLPRRAVVTNHLIGPASNDPKNVRVKQQTSTLQRKLRGDELLERKHAKVTPTDLIAMLRDRQGVGDTPLPLGDHRAIGALIAAHGVAFDLTERKIWIGGTPTLLGAFYELSLDDLFNATLEIAELIRNAPRVSSDPILTSPEFAEFANKRAN